MCHSPSKEKEKEKTNWPKCMASLRVSAQTWTIEVIHFPLDHSQGATASFVPWEALRVQMWWLEFLLLLQVEISTTSPTLSNLQMFRAGRKVPNLNSAINIPASWFCVHRMSYTVPTPLSSLGISHLSYQLSGFKTNGDHICGRAFKKEEIDTKANQEIANLGRCFRDSLVDCHFSPDPQWLTSFNIGV